MSREDVRELYLAAYAKLNYEIPNREVPIVKHDLIGYCLGC